MRPPAAALREILRRYRRNAGDHVPLRAIEAGMAE